jgi:outer membrane lipoprotein LolB
MRALAVTALLALALAGCASVPPSPPAIAVTPVPANWILQARIGILNGEQSVSGQIRWQHRVDGDDLMVISPLGQGVARIVRDAQGVALEVPNQPTRWARDADSLTQEALGYALPVAGLAWWVQALPDPARPFEAARDAAGRLARLKQDGWTINYLQYTADARPRKLVVTREALEIRLVADSWQAE